MKIAFIGRGHLRNNASTLRALGLGKELKKLGHEVFLFLPDFPSNRELRESTSSYLNVQLCSSGVLEFPSKINMMLKYSFDIIHSLNIGSKSYFIAYVYRLLKGSGLLIADMDEWNSKLFSHPVRKKFIELLENLALKKSDCIICASKSLAQKFLEHSKRNIHYLPYAVDSVLFNRQSTGFEKLRIRFYGKKLIVYVGSFQPHFDLDIAVSAARKVVIAEKNSLFIFIGNGPLREQIQKIAETVSAEHFYFPGYLPDESVAQYLRAADVLILPLRDNDINRSRCPNKLFLYLAAGRPIVTNKVGEVDGIMGDEAHYFNPSDSSDFSEKIIEALKMPKQISNERIQRNSWKERTNQYLEIIAELK